jgi:gas vesicle protein
MSENNVSKGLFLGFLAGGVVGAVLALLYAPKSGKELRSDIKVKTDGYMDEADKYIEEAKDRAKELINEGKKKSEKLISDAKVKSDELLKDAEKIFSDAKSKSTWAVNTGKQTLETEGTRLKDAVKAGVDAYKSTKNS